jgi:hypothetical protein
MRQDRISMRTRIASAPSAVAASLLVALLAPAAREARAADEPGDGRIRWSKPVLVSAEQAPWFPNVVADPTGQVHLFWSAERPQADFVMGCRPTVDGCRTHEEVAVRLGTDGNYRTRPVASADRRGTLHLLWRSKGSIAYQSLFLPDSAEGWASPPRSLGGGNYSAIFASPGDVLHAAFSTPVKQEGACAWCGDIFYRRSADGGHVWSEQANISGTAMGSDKPMFAAGVAGEIYLAWEEGHDFYVGRGLPAGVMVAVSRDEGLTWERPVSPTGGIDPPQSPAIAVDGQGAAVLVWRPARGDGVFFQRSTDQGRSWSEPEPVAGVLRRWHAADELDGLALAADGAGDLHLLVTGRIALASTINALYHVQWRGGAWSQPVEIFRTGGAPEWPRLAVNEGNRVHAVWFERAEGSVWKSPPEAMAAIWYAEAISSAPHVAPVAWPEMSRWRILAPRAAAAVQILVAMLIVGGVILWARRHAL